MTVEYSDGFGRLMQQRSLSDEVRLGTDEFGDSGLPTDPDGPDSAGWISEPEADPGDPNGAGPHVVVSGWRTFDDGGQVAEVYEPFFDRGWAFARPSQAARRAKVTRYRDPLGRAVRTVRPDGGVRLSIHGVPGTLAVPDLSDPGTYEPTPWETYVYDENDNAGRTHPLDRAVPAAHRNTPSSTTVDALGRVIRSVERGDGAPAVTSTRYDVVGNVTGITDALGRETASWVHDRIGRELRFEHRDRGVVTTVRDAAGEEVEEHDDKGSFTLVARDALGRVTHRWSRDRAGEGVTLRERNFYGDAAGGGLTAKAARAGNLLGRPWRAYDEAGLHTVQRYDWRGEAAVETRRVLRDTVLLPVLAGVNGDQGAPLRVDWRPPVGATLAAYADALLDQRVYRIEREVDALGRVVVLRPPRPLGGGTAAISYRYGLSGRLTAITVDSDVLVERISYDARGRRILCLFGDGLMTRHAYDAATGRLARLRTEHHERAPDGRLRARGPVLQDLSYTYDRVGNIVTIRDRRPGAGVPGGPAGPHALDRLFEYDARYRLRRTTGRRCGDPSSRPWNDPSRCTDPSRIVDYIERYTVDAVGGVTRIDNTRDASRIFTLPAGTDRVASMTVGATVRNYVYDAAGNMVQEAVSRFLQWDWSSRPRAFLEQAPNSASALRCHYLFDAAGQRIKKLVRHPGGQWTATVYIGAFFEHRYGTTPATREHAIVHLVDGDRRMATIRTGSADARDVTPPVTFHLGDHLESSNVIVDVAGGEVSREEFSSYGEATLRTFVRKRYRFCGRERDEESGFRHHGERLFAPWLARFTSPDPAGTTGGPRLYAYALANPMRLLDATGRNSTPPPSNVPKPPFPARGEWGHVEWYDLQPPAKRARPAAGPRRFRRCPGLSPRPRPRPPRHAEDPGQPVLVAGEAGQG